MILLETQETFNFFFQDSYHLQSAIFLSLLYTRLCFHYTDTTNPLILKSKFQTSSHLQCWFVSDLIGHQNCCFSHAKAQLSLSLQAIWTDTMWSCLNNLTIIVVIVIAGNMDRHHVELFKLQAIWTDTMLSCLTN